MPNSTPPSGRARWIALAVAGAVLAAAAGIYVAAPRDSNVTRTADGLPAPHGDTACAAAAETAARLEPFARGQLAAFRPSEAPVLLGDLAFRAPDGTPATLADFAGRTTLVNLWATWCVPCRAEMPALDRLARAAGSDAFFVLPINLDTVAGAKPAAFLAEIGAEALPLYADPELKSLNALKRRGMILGGLPTTLLVDPRGCVLGLIEGPAEWDSPDALALVGAATGRPPGAVATDAAVAPVGAGAIP